MIASIAQVQRLSQLRQTEGTGTPLVLVERPEMPAVERRMHALASQIGESPASHIMVEQLTAGGKRIRARLALAVYEQLGGIPAKAIDWAGAVELLHNATLVHDDIQDGDTVRRNQPTAWAAHGVPQALNTGDLMLMLPTLALGGLDCEHATRWRLAEAIARRSSQTVHGQSREMELLQRGQLDWRSYLDACEGKTGQLLALPVEGAALLAGLHPSMARILGDIFIQIGVLYQLQDDARDLFANKGRGSVGCDLREGKVSALVVAHLEQHPQDTDWLVDILRAPRNETRSADIAEVVIRFRHRGAWAQVKQMVADRSAAIVDTPVLDSYPGVKQVASELVQWIEIRAKGNG